MKSWTKLIVAGVASIVVTLLFVLFVSTPRASAIPAFARRYQTSCTTCHVLPPKLNAFGVAFKNNGYQIPVEDEKFIKQPDVELGAPAWKKVWPKGVWPGAIADRFPVSAAVELATTVTDRKSVV